MAIILASGYSSRLGEDKASVHLLDKPLIKYVLDAVDNIAGEKIVFTNSEERLEILLISQFRCKRNC